MEEIKVKSLKLNMILNGIKGLLTVIFPLITFPYISNVLGVENIGKYNFASSIISYFLLIAGLGISLYAIREGALIRNNKEELKKFASQIFSINMISTIASYIVLIILTLVVPKINEYYILIFILSLEIVFKTIGIEWIYSIYEDYTYITIRSIIFQIISLILMFILVHKQEDLYIYAGIATFSNVGSNILNYIYSRKYCNVKITKNIDFKKHIKPIMIFFATTVTSVIYVNSDITVLGFLTTDYNVGIYSVATKVYVVIKTLLSSIIVVSIPRCAALISKSDKTEFKNTAEKIYKMLLTIIMPAIVGIIVLRREIVLLISNQTYIEAIPVLTLLSLAIFFALGAYYWGQTVMLPLKKEKKLLKITVISAIINVVLNLILIPIWKEKAAAITTIIAEAIVFVYCRYESKKSVEMDNFIPTFIKSLIGCAPIVLINIIIKRFVTDSILAMLLIIILSVISYGIVEIILKNEIVIYYLKTIYNKFIIKGKLEKCKE